MSSALVVYSWPRLWSMGTGRGSPDFFHSLLSLTRAFDSVTVVYPRERDSQFINQVPPGIEAVGFGYWKAPLLRSPRGPKLLRALVFAVNWPLRMFNYCTFNLSAILAARKAYGESPPTLVTAHGFMGVQAAAWTAGSAGAPLVVRLFGISLGTKGVSLPVRMAQFEESLAFKVNAVRWVITDDGSGGRQTALRLDIHDEYVKMVRAAAGQEFAGRAEPPARDQYRRGLGLDPRTLVVLRVCRLWTQQHVERLIEALPLETPDGAPVAVVIVGDGPERSRLENLAQALGKNVIFTGALPNADLPAHYIAADLYAATADRTNLSQSVLESLAHGLPVLAIDAGTTAELIRDGETGRLVPPGDPEALHRALETLLADEEIRRRLSLGGRCIAREMIPDTEQRIAAEASLYNELLIERG